MNIRNYFYGVTTLLILTGFSSSTYATSCIAYEGKNRTGAVFPLNANARDYIDYYTPERERGINGLGSNGDGTKQIPEAIRSAAVAEKRKCELRIYDCVYPRTSWPWCKGPGRARRFVKKDTMNMDIQSDVLGGLWLHCFCPAEY